jgi:competence protein ComEC
MVGIAVAIAVGMVVSASGIATFHFLVLLSLMLVLVALVPAVSGFSNQITFLAVATVAACCYILASSEISMAGINQIKNDLPKQEIHVVGRVSSFPEFHASRSRNQGTWVFTLACEGLRFSNAWNKVRGNIDVRIAGEESEKIARYGQRIKMGGKLGNQIFPGGNPIELQASSSETLGLEKFSPVAFGRALRDKAAEQLGIEMENMPEQEAVLKALVLGYRKEMPSETLDRFRRTGTLHIFAISGLHVGIMGLLLCMVLKMMGIPRDWFGVWLLPLLAIYVISTGMKPSALRALTMAGVFVLAPLFRCKPDVPSSVAFAAIALLLFNPLEIQSAGFIFSFTVVAFIVMAYSVVPAKLKQGRWIRCYSVGLVLTSIAANLASIPLSALYFGVFSPIALLGNLIVVPLTFCIVLSGWLSILVPVASAVFNHAAVLFINLLLGGVAWLDALPGSSWQVNPPSILSIVLWYGSLIYLFTHATVRKQRIHAISAAGLAILLVLLS